MAPVEPQIIGKPKGRIKDGFKPPRGLRWKTGIPEFFGSYQKSEKRLRFFLPRKYQCGQPVQATRPWSKSQCFENGGMLPEISL